MAQVSTRTPDDQQLPAIPVLDVGASFAIEVARQVGARSFELLDAATAGVPLSALRIADAVSRRWLKARRSPYLAEIDAIAALGKRPGVYYLNVDYEWGCTTAARIAPGGTSARLLRVLDWDVRGIGRYVVAARIASPFGPWVSLTWPGFTGVLQAMAPNRFAAAINQPSLRRRAGLAAIDRLLGWGGVWRSPHLQPIHLLRRVFEQAPDFAGARTMLETTPICTPVIFTLAGTQPHDTCVIERRETSARTLPGPICAANEWQTPDWHPRHFPAFENAARLAAMSVVPSELDAGFGWLRWPLLNRETRLVLAADAAQGRLIAQGYEADGAATRVLEMAF